LKEEVFRCLSLTEFNAWMKCIRELQGETEDKSRELKIQNTKGGQQVADTMGIKLTKA
jgi:hypothetical protein